MIIETLKLAKKSLGTPDKTREFPTAELEHVRLDDTALARITLQPGWKWSQDVRPAGENGKLPKPPHPVRPQRTADDRYGRRHQTELEPGRFRRHPAWTRCLGVGDEPLSPSISRA